MLQAGCTRFLGKTAKMRNDNSTRNTTRIGFKIQYLKICELYLRKQIENRKNLNFFSFDFEILKILFSRFSILVEIRTKYLAQFGLNISNNSDKNRKSWDFFDSQFVFSNTTNKAQAFVFWSRSEQYFEWNSHFSFLQFSQKTLYSQPVAWLAPGCVCVVVS